MDQLEIHKKIDACLKQTPLSIGVDSVRTLIDLNFDARNYFFSTANEKWIKWLSENGFFEVLKQPSDDAAKYSYRLPELQYLVQMIEKDPQGVAGVVVATPITKENLNLEVIDRFLWIVSSLPAEQIKILAPKIRDEQWIPLMRIDSRSAYEFERIIKRLMDADDAESVLIIAQILLQVRDGKEFSPEEKSYLRDNPFYMTDIGQSGIFSALTQIKEEFTEKIFALTTSVLGRLVEIGDRDPDDTVFPVSDSLYLYDVDFFSLDVAQERHISHRDDVRDLAAVIRTTIEKTIGQADKEEARRLFSAYIDSLPDSRDMWRLRLFTLSQRPDVFKKELKKSFFRLFETDRYHEIDSGTEYKKSLKKAFGVLSDAEQRDYVAKVLEYFERMEKQNPDQNWHRRHGWEILSSIDGYLTPEEKKLCRKYFGNESDSTYEPEPEIGKIRSGFVEHRSPANLDNSSIEEIIERLKTEWTQEALKEKYGRDDFLFPRGVEGLGDELKKNIKKRVAEYTQKAPSFFDRELIHPHYTYSYLRSIEEMLREQKLPADTDWKGLFELFDSIVASGSNIAFERKKDDNWLTNWIGVLDALADLLLQATSSGDREMPFDFATYRDRIAGILKYLFSIDDPRSEDEGSDRGDLFHIAINSVRGRAFQILTQFIYHDGKDFEKTEEVRIKPDIKEIYENVVRNDRALSIRFVIGHYFASFYYRDKVWIRNLLPQIFPQEPEEMDQFLAAWEGYLTGTLYKEIYEEFQKYYSFAIDIDPSTYTKRKYIKEIDEALAVHMALAFAHFTNLEDDLFKKFWNTPNTARHEEFVSFIGRHNITRDQAGDEWFKENGVSKQKLMDFWEWLLKRENVPPEVFSGFGFWVNPKKEIFESKWLASKMSETMKKATGKFDWEYGLMEQLPNLAKISPKETLEIIRHYLLDGEKLNPHRRGWIHIDRELRTALDVLYANDAMKKEVYELINTLITVGGSQFWPFKGVLH